MGWKWLAMILPTLRADQGAILRHPAKVKVVTMGRRWGKTVLGGAVVANTVRHHRRAAWVTPTYKNSRPLWRWLVKAAADDIKAGRIVANKSDRSFETLPGGFLGLYSADNIDSIRGEYFDVVVVDEAAFIDSLAWSDAIMPTLADTDGSALLIGTPKGKNWFHREFIKGIDRNSDNASWQAPTIDNPMPNIRTVFERAKRTVSERSFRQEWLAEFIEGGELFRFVDDARIDCWTDTPIEGHEYVAGLDWAFSVDYTVLTVFDTTTNQVAYVDRFNGVDYTMQRDRVAATVNRFGCHAVVSETNSMGRPNNEMLIEMGLPVVEFTTTNRTKGVIVEDLAAAFDNKVIGIPATFDPLYAELQIFEADQTKNGSTRYGAPSGAHDDCVMSLALAYSARNEAKGLLLW